MAKIEKKAVKMSDPSYRGRAAEKRKTNLDLRARLTERRASERIEGYSRANKQEKYTSDLDILDKVDEDTRGEVGYKLLGNRKLRIDNKGQLTRERGIILKTRKVIERSADTGASILRRFEKDSWRTKKTEEYDKDGQLRSKSVVRKDGRYKENWVRDEKGTLIRTSYFNNRWQDRRLFRPISEELSSADLNGRRILTRRQFASEKVFERNQDGNLELISRKGPLSFRHTRTSADRKTSKTYVSYLGGLFSNSYQSRLDQNGDLLSKDILCRRTLWSKSSAEYDDKGRITKATSTVWKLYGSESQYLGGEVKKVTKNVLGVKFSTKIKMMSDRELEAQKLRAEEAATHSAAWEPKPLVHCSSAPAGRQSEPNARNNLDRVMEAIAGQGGSVRANGTSPR
ncbi:virA/G regulated protein, partial [Bradyrhizobium sp. Arg314]